MLACHWRSNVGKTQAERASKLADGIISISDTPGEYKDLVDEVNSLIKQLGRDVDGFERSMYLTVNVNKDKALAQQNAEEFLLEYYGANIWGDRWGPFGDTQEIKERMLEYIEAGAKTLIIRFASLDPERQLDMFLNDIAPFV